MAPRPVQPDAGTPNAQAFVVSKDDVLAKRNALIAEADDFQAFLDRIQHRLFMRPCGDDPVSHDVARAVTHRAVGPSSDSYWNVCKQWADNLYKAADALTETAKAYGFTDAEIAASLGRDTPDA